MAGEDRQSLLTSFYTQLGMITNNRITQSAQPQPNERNLMTKADELLGGLGSMNERLAEIRYKAFGDDCDTAGQSLAKTDLPRPISPVGLTLDLALDRLIAAQDQITAILNRL